jgi:hypothetical protein
MSDAKVYSVYLERVFYLSINKDWRYARLLEDGSYEWNLYF